MRVFIAACITLCTSHAQLRPNDATLAFFFSFDASNPGDETIFGALPAGVTSVADRFGVPSKALNVVPTSSATTFLSAAPANLPCGNAPRTVTAWFQTSTGTCPSGPQFSGKTIVQWGNPTATNARWLLALGNGWGPGAGFPGIGAYNNDFFPLTTNIIDGNWHFIAATFNGTSLALFEDCAVLASTTTSYNTACGSTLSLFKSVGAAYNELYGGSVDDIRIYNTSKTFNDLSTIASCCFASPGSFCALFFGNSTPCAPGSFQNSSRALFCFTCPAGSYCPLGSTNATLCPKGSFSSAGASNCTLCPAGTFSSTIGSTSCQQCPGGHYCPAGTSLRAGLNCGKGNYCPDGSGTPTPCPYQVSPPGGWGALQHQGPAYLVETAQCLNHCFWNLTSGDGVLSKC